jgi:hypothetical protein
MNTTTATSPINYANEAIGQFGVFLTNYKGAAVQRRCYQDELPSLTAMIATAQDEHAAASAACRWLAQMDRSEDATRLALVIRDRDKRRNVALIQWVQRFGSPGNEYRYSVECWAYEAVRVPVRAGRERRPLD